MSDNGRAMRYPCIINSDSGFYFQIQLLAKKIYTNQYKFYTACNLSQYSAHRHNSCQRISNSSEASRLLALSSLPAVVLHVILRNEARLVETADRIPDMLIFILSPWKAKSIQWLCRLFRVRQLLHVMYS